MLIRKQLVETEFDVLMNASLVANDLREEVNSVEGKTWSEDLRTFIISAADVLDRVQKLFDVEQAKIVLEQNKKYINGDVV